MLQHVELLKAMMKELQTSLHLLTAKVDNLMRSAGATRETCELPDDVKFLLTSIHELDLFKHQRQDSQLKLLVVN